MEIIIKLIEIKLNVNGVKTVNVGDKAELTNARGLFYSVARHYFSAKDISQFLDIHTSNVYRYSKRINELKSSFSGEIYEKLEREIIKEYDFLKPTLQGVCLESWEILKVVEKDEIVILKPKSEDAVLEYLREEAIDPRQFEIERISFFNDISIFEKPYYNLSNNISGFNYGGLEFSIARLHGAEIRCDDTIFVDVSVVLRRKLAIFMSDLTYSILQAMHEDGVFNDENN